jgi:hypothetical protein
MPETELDQRIRHLTDAGGPVTLDEVINRSQQPAPWRRRTRRREQIFPVLVAALVAVAILVAVTVTAHHHHTQDVSISASPSVSVSTPPASAAPVLSTVGTSTPPLPGCVLYNGVSATPPTSYVAGDQWKCPASAAEGQEVTGAAVPDPAVPAGYVPAYQPIIYVAPGPLSDAVYQRAWAPPGTFTAAGATGPYIELRVRAHQPDGWNLGYTQTVTLAKGTQATATFSLRPKTYPGTPSNTVDDGSNGITWSNAGLDYSLEVYGLSPQAILTVANSLP